MSVPIYRIQCERQWFVMAVTVFNAVVQLCVLEIQSAFKRCLNVPSAVKGHVQLTKCKRWKKVKPLLKLYLMDLLKVRIVHCSYFLIKLHLKCYSVTSKFCYRYKNFTFTNVMFSCIVYAVGGE